jgi:hypothetical protein
LCRLGWSVISARWRVKAEKFHHFPCNSRPNLAQYISERPETTSQGERSKTAKKQSTKGKTKMKRLNITFGTILLVLGCFAFSPAAKADPPIAGLWHEYYTSDFGPPFETYAQWHSDGLEIETPNFLNGVCMGTWKQIAGRTVKLFHVGWTPGGIPPAPTSVRFELRHLDTVSVDGNSFDGTYDQKFFDANGNLVFEDMGTIHATRLSVDQFAESNPTARR